MRTERKFEEIPLLENVLISPNPSLKHKLQMNISLLPLPRQAIKSFVLISHDELSTANNNNNCHKNLVFKKDFIKLKIQNTKYTQLTMTLKS